MKSATEGKLIAPGVEKIKAQLKLWSLEIDRLTAKTQKASVPVRFGDLMYIDELKALHAIAQAKLAEFRAAGDTERERLETEMRSAWNELGAAFKNLQP